MKYSLYKRAILKNFFAIDLTSVEKSMAEDAVVNKYAEAVRLSIVLSVLALPAIVFLDTTLLATVLIPITMVAGTAWFAISLASVKKKFEDFGLELTRNMFTAFTTSLLVLSLLVLVALLSPVFDSITSWGSEKNWVLIVSGILGTLVIFKIAYDVFQGSMKYDINDTMLAGQNEAAEIFFKRSLSLLHQAAANLKRGGGPEVANYNLGLAFSEIFHFVLSVQAVSEKEATELINQADTLRKRPSMERADAIAVIVPLVESFLRMSSAPDKTTRKGFKNITLEIMALKNNTNEPQAVIDNRFATILEETATAIESHGESLFTKRIEIERKFLIPNLPKNLEQHHSVHIRQGYIIAEDTEELRVRKIDDDTYTKTHKRTLANGHREETETYIARSEYERLWGQTTNKRVEKTRYFIPYDELRIELDVFAGNNNGLQLAEVEFESEELAGQFTAPQWFGKEVTDDSAYKNKNLAR